MEGGREGGVSGEKGEGGRRKEAAGRMDEGCKEKGTRMREKEKREGGSRDDG